jgi:hypothetical protein
MSARTVAVRRRPTAQSRVFSRATTYAVALSSRFGDAILRTAQNLVLGALLTISLLISACTFSDDLTGQVDRINKSVEQVQNEAILHNVIRASEGAPLNFTQLAVVRGSGTVSGTLGLPVIPIGGAPAVQPPTEATGIASASSNTNFDLGILESKEFWLGLQTPLSPETLDFFVREGLPREILFYLYIGRVELSSAGKTRVLVNDPANPTFPEFTAALRTALRMGLTTETIPHVITYGPPLPAAKASDMRDLVELAKAGLVLRRTSTSAGTGYQVESVKSAARLCFNPGLVSEDAHYFVGTQSTCGVIGGSGDDVFRNTSAHSFRFGTRNGTTGEKGETKVTIYPRSTLDVFRYLGSLAKTRARIELITEEARSFNAATMSHELFVINVNSPADSFVSVKYRGVSYSIPRRATATIHILTLLRRLVALNTSVNSLPMSSTVTTVVR